MKIETLHTVSFVFYLLAAVFFVITIALFFIFNISKIIGYLSGKTEKKAVKNMKNKNYDWEYQEIKREVPKINSDISKTVKLDESDSQEPAYTTKLSPLQLQQAADEKPGFSPYFAQDDNTFANESSAKTAVLEPADDIYSSKNNEKFDVKSNLFVVEYEILFTASSEIIR